MRDAEANSVTSIAVAPIAAEAAPADNSEAASSLYCLITMFDSSCVSL